MATDWTELNSVFRTVFGNPQINLNSETTANDIFGWDSFSHMNLIAAIEDHFNVQFTQYEALNFQSVGELKQAIDNKLGH